jgi:hypothetical protein
MYKSICLSVCLFLRLSGILDAQTLSPSIIASAGGFSSNLSGMNSYTVAEMVAIETFFSPSVVLTQGFQQPWDLSTSIEEEIWHDFSFDVYPNPSNGNFYIIHFTQQDLDVTLKVTNVLGTPLMEDHYITQAGSTRHSCDLSGMIPGVYFLTIHAKRRNDISWSRFVKKIHISQ